MLYKFKKRFNQLILATSDNEIINKNYSII